MKYLKNKHISDQESKNMIRKTTIEKNRNTSTTDSIQDERTIPKTQLAKGIENYSIDLQSKDSKPIHLKFLPDSTLQFLFCKSGALIYQHDGIDKKRTYEINQYQTAVCYAANNKKSYIQSMSDEKTRISIITIDLHSYSDQDKGTFNLSEDSQLNLIVAHIKRKEFYFYRGSMDFHIAEKFERINNDYKDNEISHKLSQSGIYFLILSEEIAKFSREIYQLSDKNPLAKNEFKTLIELTTAIKQQPDKSYLIDDVCRKTGLSPAKLQIGIRYLYDTTFSDFIRNIRLEKAEELIRTTDLNISEIVYTVGLTSRSYFCKVFKNKYKCSPRAYRNEKIKSSDM